ncbi:MAG: hypothetical protein ABS882_04070, partial [Lysinibacillus sp.]
MGYSNIPLELQERNQWVVYEQAAVTTDKGEVVFKKYPLQTNDDMANVNCKNTWNSFENVLATKDTYKYDGIGFVFNENDPYVGIDFDNCIDGDGQLDPQVAAIVECINSYTELSPSGTGIHIIVKADITDFIVGKGMNKKDAICEIYYSSRYFTMTGKVLFNHLHIKEATEHVKTLIEIHYPEKMVANQKNQEVKNYPRLNVSKQRVLKKMFKSKYGKEIRKLYEGKVTPENCGKSQSEIDFTLCMQLAFWCRKDKVLMKEILLDSKLNRDKFYRVDLGQQCY